MTTVSVPPGTLYWLTGLAGAGKTTIARELTEQLRRSGKTPIHLDGDVLRGIVGSDNGEYDLDSRRELAMRYAYLCKLLTAQGVDVVCSTISLFADVHEFNRRENPRYFEVLLHVEMAVLRQRDKKQLYSAAEHGAVTEVAGVDVPVVFPKDPHLVIDNGGARSPREIAKEIVNASGDHVARWKEASFEPDGR